MTHASRPDRLVLVRHCGARVCWRPINRAREAAVEITRAATTKNALCAAARCRHVHHIDGRSDIPLLSTGSAVHPGHGDDALETQARMLGHAGVEVISLMQTTASLDCDDFDEIVVKQMRDAAGVPAVTGARRSAMPCADRPGTTMPILERHHYEHKYGLEVVVHESFSGAGGPEAVRDAMVRINRPGIEVMIVRGGGTLPTMAFLSQWERALSKPVINPNQALLWAMLDIMKVDERLPGLGRLLAERPPQV